MGSFSVWHWLVVLFLVVLLFGRGKVSAFMGDIGKGLRDFKRTMSDVDEINRQPDPDRRLPRRPADTLPRDE